MKRCPQCSTVYSDETQYCLNDGAVLIEENSPSSETEEFEEETIIRHDPIVVDFGAANQPTEQFNYQPAPPANRPTIIVEKQRNTGKYLLFLIVGLVLGGGLVLVGLLTARTFSRGDTMANGKTSNKTQTEKVLVSNQSPSAQANAVENINSQSNANLALNDSSVVEANKIHEEKTSAADDEFNGRVITLNAYLRAAPSKTSSQVSILPKGDRLKIGERENPNSPWYKVTCEHGESGWMHGDTIEFTN